MIDCIIVEDEPLATSRIVEYIRRVSYLNLVKTFDNGVAAVEYLTSNKVHLIFLDIQMEGLTGIEVIETLSIRPDVILTTAYDQYAVKGFELNVTDYLLKPFSFQRFLVSVSKVEQKRGLSQATDAGFIFVKTEYRLEKIFTNDILFIEGVRDYRRIHTRDKKIMTLQTFTELDESLSPQGFCRVHNSYIVSLSKIDFVERDRIRIGKELIPISDTYKSNFYKMIS